MRRSPTLFVCSKCTIQRHITKFQQFWLHLVYFVHLLIFFELVDPEIEKHYKWTLKMLKVGMLSSFHPHSMCSKVERATTKTGCSSCTKRTISLEVSGFRTRTHLLQRDFICFEFIWTPYFLCVQNAPCKGTSQNFNNFWLHLVFFVHLLFFWASWPWNWKELQMNSKNVESWHAIIISPT